MNNINTGGPAFPPSNPGYAHGMTLRDYFAAFVISGMLSDPMIDAEAEVLAQKAYDMADALLKAREAA